MGIPSRDNSTPVFLAWNISQHFSGTARTIGAALVGHFGEFIPVVLTNIIFKYSYYLIFLFFLYLLTCLAGVRTFTSNTASSSFQYVGGPAVLLSLVAMATDDSSLYAAVKVLLSVLDTNPVMKQEMKHISGYKVPHQCEGISLN